MVSVVVPRIQFEGAFHLASGSVAIPLEQVLDEPRRVVALGEAVVEGDASRCRRLGPRHRGTRRDDPVERQERITVGEAGIRRREVAVRGDRLVEQRNRLFETDVGPAVPRVPALQVQVVRLYAFGRGPYEWTRPTLDERRAKRPRDRLSDLVLRREDLIARPVVRARPPVIAALRLDELALHAL